MCVGVCVRAKFFFVLCTRSNLMKSFSFSVFDSRRLFVVEGKKLMFQFLINKRKKLNYRREISTWENRKLFSLLVVMGVVRKF